MWVRYKKDSLPLFWIFFSFSLSCTELNMKLLQCSRYRFQHRGQFPCISLSPSFCPASSSCTPPSPPPSASCKPVSVWLKGGLTHSFTAMQPHHQSSSQWQASTLHSQQPFNPFYQTHPSSVTTLSMVCCLGGSRIHLFMHVFPEEIMSMKEFMYFTAAAVQTV